MTYDAIVIGSGISGGWAAKELAEKGLKVLLLERGRNIEHVTGYTTASKRIWEFPHRGRLTQAMKAAHPVQKRDYPYSEFSPDFWGERPRLPIHRSQTIRLVPRLSRRRQIAHVGPAELPLERF